MRGVAVIRGMNVIITGGMLSLIGIGTVMNRIGYFFWAIN